MHQESAFADSIDMFSFDFNVINRFDAVSLFNILDGGGAIEGFDLFIDLQISG